MWIAKIYLHQKSSPVMGNLSKLGGEVGRKYEGRNRTFCNKHVKLGVGSQACIKQQLSTSKFKPKKYSDPSQF